MMTGNRHRKGRQLVDTVRGMHTAQENDATAFANRKLLAEKRVFAVNVVAASRSGKTSVILATIEALRDEFNLAVIEGDMASRIQAERINQRGIPAVQVDAEPSGHLSAACVRDALAELDLDGLDLVIIENAGDPSGSVFVDVGEGLKVLVTAVSEGDAKPLEAPEIFRRCHAVLVNKIDMADQCGFDLDRFCSLVRKANASAPIFPVVATTGEGVEAWADWLRSQI